MLDDTTEAVIDAFAATLFHFLQERNAALYRYNHPVLIEQALSNSLARTFDEPEVERMFREAGKIFIHEVNDRLVAAGYINNSQ